MNNIFSKAFDKLQYFTLFHWPVAKPFRRWCEGPKGTPYAVTHDGRTLRYPDPDVQADSLRSAILGWQIMAKHTSFERLIPGMFQVQ